MSRDRRRGTGINNEEQYADIFEARGVRSIEQLRTPKFSELPQNIDTVVHVWKQGDTFWKLSNRYFGIPKYWYLIAKFNAKPTEAHISIGESILIPVDIKPLLRLL